MENGEDMKQKADKREEEDGVEIETRRWAESEDGCLRRWGRADQAPAWTSVPTENPGVKTNRIQVSRRP